MSEHKSLIPTVEAIETEIAWHKNEIRGLLMLRTAARKHRVIPRYPLLEAAGIVDHLEAEPSGDGKEAG